MSLPIPFGTPNTPRRQREVERELMELFNSVNTQSRVMEARAYLARKGIRVFNDVVDDLRYEAGDDPLKQQFAATVVHDLGRDLRTMISGQ